MSSKCENIDKPKTVDIIGCPCDQWIYPPPVDIPAGMQRIPRQIAGFPEFRKALLAASRVQNALASWRARELDDLGVMLLEMGAYILDVLAFYDETIANECYLRTALLRPSVRKIVGLIGYRPKPAVGAKVTLAAFAEGRKSIKLPAGTAFRSGAFDGEPPQVFELSSEVSVHPLMNSWRLQRTRRKVLHSDDKNLHRPLLVPNLVRLDRGSIVNVYVKNEPNKNVQVCQVQKVEPVIGRDGDPYVQLQLDKPLQLSDATNISNIRIETPLKKARLWSGIGSIKPLKEIDNCPRTITLDGVYKEIRQGEKIVLRRGNEFRWYNVDKTQEVKKLVTEKVNINGFEVPVPVVAGPATVVTLDEEPLDNKERSNLPEGKCRQWTKNELPEIDVLYDFIEAGVLTVEQDTYLGDTDTVTLIGPLESTGKKSQRGEFVLTDADEIGVKTSGRVYFSTEKISFDPGVKWNRELRFPVQVFGNVFTATRGESVVGEILGSGDASIANQSFKLAKKPLTYLAKPTAENEAGVANTLQIYVDGVEWTEVPSFFGVSGEHRVYIIRQDDAGESHIIFGDGHCGARLPSGRDNVIANYRYGAGAAAPPVGSITQIARPVKGLKSVRNPLAAGGGDDAESAKNMQAFAPQSALLLGRAVSIIDIETAAAQYPGVRAAMARWDWDGTRQRPLVKVWYIADADLSEGIHERLQALTDPSTPIFVCDAVSVTAVLEIELLSDARYLREEVEADVRLCLMQPRTGLLVPENIGIGKLLYRSQIFNAVLNVPGATAVRSLILNGESFSAHAKTPGAGKYYNFEAGLITFVQSEKA
jgi:hypothetical protein